MLSADTFKTIFEAKTTTQITPTRQFGRVRFSPCGTTLLAAGHDGLVHRWSLAGESPAELPQLTGHNGWVQTVVCRTEGELVVSADSWGGLRCGGYLGDAPAVAWTKADAHDGWILDVSLSPDGRQLATCGIDRLVRVWDAGTGTLVRELPGHTTEVFCVRFAPDGRSLFSGDLDGRVRQSHIEDGSLIREFDAASLHLSHRLQEVGGARHLAMSASGDTLLVGGTKPKNGGNVQGAPTILVFDSTTATLKTTITLGVEGDVYVTDMIELPDGDWLATVSGNPGAGKVVAFRLDADKPFYETKKYPNCHSIAWHAPTRRIALSTTNAGSNGNGRQLKNGEYPGNFSPVFLFQLPE